MSLETLLDIVAQEAGVPRDEIQDDTEFSDLGIDQILAQAITNRFADEASQQLPVTVFDKYPDVRSLIEHFHEANYGCSSTATPAAPPSASERKVAPLQQRSKNIPNPVGKSAVGPNGKAAATLKKTGGAMTAEKVKRQESSKKTPIVLPLQGSISTARKTIFLLPDGSGSGMAYARLPRVASDVCLCGVNSPFLGKGVFTTTIEYMGSVFAAAIREAKPHGPYILGGWSAGGYTSTEVARILIREGETVESVILIDSPCRLEYESLPMDVVDHLAPRNLMGNWGNKQTPQWLVDHFRGTLDAVSRYTPAKIEGVPNVFVIEASEGIFATHEELEDTGLDLNNMLTRHLLGPRPKIFDPHGWDRVFVGSDLRWSRSSGNHFTMVHSPHHESLGSRLRDTQVSEGKRTCRWEQWKGKRRQ